MTKPSILFLLDNPFTNDRRVYREAKTMVDAGYPLVLIAVAKTGIAPQEVVEGISVARILQDDIYDVKQSRCFARYSDQIIQSYTFDIIHAHDQVMLHLAVTIKRKKPTVKIIYDSHELFHAWPLNTNATGFTYLKSEIVRFLLKRREARNIKHIDALIAVNEPIRLDILDFFSLKIPSISIRNLPTLPPPASHQDLLRKKFNIAATDKILVYIGANIYPKTINIEQVIREFANKEHVFMVFICALNWGQKEVKKYADSIGVTNLYFHDVVPIEAIPDYLCDATAGIVSSWNKKDLSYWYGLDNKLFEYMMAEIPIVATEQPEYIKIVRDHAIGICINPEKESYFDAFEKIAHEPNAYQGKLKAAKSILNWENESLRLLDFYSELAK